MPLEYAISESSKHELFSGQNVLPRSTQQRYWPDIMVRCFKHHPKPFISRFASSIVTEKKNKAKRNDKRKVNQLQNPRGPFYAEVMRITPARQRRVRQKPIHC